MRHIAQAAVFTVFARLIITILYGKDFMPAALVMQILVWYYAFAFMSSVRNVWILVEGKQGLMWIINLSGVVVNISLNAVLIPYFGACGAAAASLTTRIFTNFTLGFIIRPIRESNTLMLKGINPKFAYGKLAQLFGKYLNKGRSK